MKNIISSSLFTYDFQSKTMTVELSTLTASGYTPFGQIYLDSCDSGFTMISHKTGVSVDFYLSHMEKDDDGFRFWKFQPITKHVAKARGVTVIIFND